MSRLLSSCVHGIRSICSTAVANPGLFGIQQLQHPGDFTPLVQDTLKKSESIVSEILCRPPTLAIVQLMDDLSDELCRTYDAAECCRQVHSNPAWRTEANKACVAIIEYISAVNTDVRMYQKVKKVCQLRPPSLTSSDMCREKASTFQETMYVAEKLLMDFEKAGVHLPDDQREAVCQLVNQNAQFPILFNQALTGQREVSSVLTPHSSRSRWRGSKVRLDPGSLAAFLAHEPVEDARKQVYLAGFSGPESNLKLLDTVIADRHRMAELIGYRSYADLKLKDNTIANAPEAVVSFLHSLADLVRPHADQEMQVLRELKARNHGCHVSATRVNSWDVDFFTALARKQAGTVSPDKVSQYLALSSLLEGFSMLMRRVFGVTLSSHQLGPNEGWAQGVQKLEVMHNELGPLGTLYLDLYSSPNKYPGAVLFPIRCGRQLSSGEYQLPVLVLVLDLGPAGTNPLLRLRDVQTLVHELGHAMHCLLSRTKHQHLWGTRCAQDLVEVPSHLWERFVTDYRSFQLLARHSHTGESMPEAMHKELVHSSKLFGAYELQHQLLLALVDQRYFGPDRPGPGQSGEVWRQLAASHSSVPHAEGSQPQARFSHLTVYGATYYTYLYARCLSAAIWDKYLADDPLDSCAGNEIGRKLLEPGGAKEPVLLLQDLLDSQALQRLGNGWAPALDKGRTLQLLW